MLHPVGSAVLAWPSTIGKGASGDAVNSRLTPFSLVSAPAMFTTLTVTLDGAMNRNLGTV